MPTTTVSDSNKPFLLALPGYLRLDPRDYVIDAERRLGSGGAATVFAGRLSDEMAKERGFRDVAVKVFRPGVGEASERFELALMR